MRTTKRKKKGQNIGAMQSKLYQRIAMKLGVHLSEIAKINRLRAKKHALSMIEMEVELNAIFERSFL